MSGEIPRYNELTLQFFTQAPNWGRLHGLGVGSACAGSQSTGTWVRFDVQILREYITAARFQAFGCPHVIAIAAWLTHACPGTRMSESLPENVHALQRRFDVPVEKLGRLLLLEDAWIGAIREAVTKSREVLD